VALEKKIKILEAKAFLILSSVILILTLLLYYKKIKRTVYRSSIAEALFFLKESLIVYVKENLVT
jgi:hypothetical protein